MTTNPFDRSDVEAALNGRYVLGAEIRVGGQGVVYRSTRISDGNGVACANDVALKLHLDSRQDERVSREIQAAKNLHHSSLATLLEEGAISIGGRPTRYIAWEFIEGEALDAKLLRGALRERDAIQIGRDVTSAIAALWSKHIVHRDIAPKNIMAKTDGSAVLIDLGGARHLDNSTITMPGCTFGTPGYFSPEQFRAEHTLTCASDIFALGVVLLECLLGHHPTNRDQHVLATSPPKTALLLPSLKEALRDTLDGMLHLRAPFRPSPALLLTQFDSLLREK